MEQWAEDPLLDVVEAHQSTAPTATGIVNHFLHVTGMLDLVPFLTLFAGNHDQRPRIVR